MGIVVIIGKKKKKKKWMGRDFEAAVCGGHPIYDTIQVDAGKNLLYREISNNLYAFIGFSILCGSKRV